MSNQDYCNQDIERFYRLMDQLWHTVGGYRYLSACDGRMGWPKRGVYFFFEPGEHRSEGERLRVVRVGTHAVSKNSKSTLWGRLRTHRGHTSGKGNHRGSVFRLLVGSVLIQRQSYPSTAVAAWGKGQSAPREVRDKETIIELDVSRYIGSMPFLWVDVDDEPGSGSQRKAIERNSIALLSNINGCPDIPSRAWFGKECRSDDVKRSGLWNSDHVSENYDAIFLDLLEDKIGAMGRRRSQEELL